MTINIKSIFENFRSPFVTRNQLQELTGGMIHPKTIRNLDSLGQGIPGKFAIGPRKVAYPVTNVIAWLEERIEKNNKETTKGSESKNVNSRDSIRNNKDINVKTTSIPKKGDRSNER